MSHSNQERIAHVARRLGFGPEREIATRARTVEDAVAAALDQSREPNPPPHLDPPVDADQARERGAFEAFYRYWLEQLLTGPRRIDERLTWFFTDHFATSIQKVQIPYLMYRQHLTIRRHATGNFADLLHAMAIDPAMLIYLDGARNAAENINENFGREVLELYTLGRGNYTEEDVVAASRAFSGWVVARPEGRAVDFFDVEPWNAVFVPILHDGGVKTLLGTTGDLDTSGAIDVLLDHPATAEHVSAKLWRHLVGTDPTPQRIAGLATVFRRAYSVMDLVEAIVADPQFSADEAIRTKVRTPLEKAVGVVQAVGTTPTSGRALFQYLEAASYVPLRPPNPAGYPDGLRLLGPQGLIHTFDLALALPETIPDQTGTQLMEALGVYDVTEETLAVLDTAPAGPIRAALAINSPEYHLT